ncbi:hypothetical protein RFI_11570 [Reticulomyxa filosa]|uniref:Uncharacterized protein n=1 Tax=Reticulomyxa filosa TaxID=46433 RepID=X6NIL7_RETFI|nr:hypothetical protein RFI_11570 [Reticulomyxa filosa]|eukprot:ETO25569.1 hypothetical protein RFI_11570 [Reticulomyxa filosa]
MKTKAPNPTVPGKTSQKIENRPKPWLAHQTKSVCKEEKPNTNTTSGADENKNDTNTQQVSIPKKTKFDYSNVKPKVDTGLKKLPSKQSKDQPLDSASSRNGATQPKFFFHFILFVAKDQVFFFCLLKKTKNYFFGERTEAKFVNFFCALKVFIVSVV